MKLGFGTNWGAARELHAEAATGPRTRPWQSWPYPKPRLKFKSAGPVEKRPPQGFPKMLKRLKWTAWAAFCAKSFPDSQPMEKLTPIKFLLVAAIVLACTLKIFLFRSMLSTGGLATVIEAPHCPSPRLAELASAYCRWLRPAFPLLIC